ncbi:hypothetical protein DRQ16_01565, partial [bacterium]
SIYTKTDGVVTVGVAAPWPGDTLHYLPWSTCVLWCYTPLTGPKIVTYYPDPLWYAYGANIIGNNHMISWPTVGQEVNMGDLYVVWCEFPYNQESNGYQSGEIYISRSIDGGWRWSPKYNLTRTPDISELYPSISARITDRTLRILYEVDLVNGSYVQGETDHSDNPMHLLSIPIRETDLELVGFTGVDTANFSNTDTVVPTVTVRNNGPNEVACQVRIRIDNAADKYMWYEYEATPGDTDTLFLRLPTLLYESEKETIIGVGEEITVTLDTFNLLKDLSAWYDSVWFGNDTLYMTVETPTATDTYFLWLPSDSNHYVVEVAWIADWDISNNRFEYPAEALEGASERSLPSMRFVPDRNVVTGTFTGYLETGRPGRVEVDVYNLAGRKIVSERLDASGGRVPITVDLKDVSPGIYLYRIRTDAGETHGRFILVR